MNSSEFTIQKLNNFKSLLNKKLEDIFNKNDFSNEIIISFIFNVLKKSYYLLGKDKNRSNISINEQAGPGLIRKNSSSPLLSIQDSDNSDNEKISKNMNNIFDGSIIEDSINLGLKFLALPKKVETTNISEKIEKTEEDQKEKGTKIFFLLSKNNNPPKHVKKEESGGSFKKDEIAINCMNFIFKFIEEPLAYENKFNESKTVSNIFIYFI